MEKSYYKLGKQATIFWDPAQSENKKVLPGQVKELEVNESVENARINRGLIEVDKKEFESYEKDRKEQEEKLSKKAGGKSDDGSAAAKLADIANERLAVANQQLKEVEKKEADLEEREKTQQDSIQKHVEDLEKREKALAEREEKLNQSGDKSGKK